MAPFAGWYALGVLALFATNAVAVSIPLVLADAVEVLRTGADPEGRLPGLALTAAGLGVVVFLTRWASRVLFFTPGRYVETRIKADLLVALLRHQPSFHRQYTTGDLVSRTTHDISFLRLLGGFVALQIVNSALAFGLTFAQLLRLSPGLAIGALVPVLLGSLAIQGLIRKMFLLVRQLQEEMGALSNHILTTYQGVATVQAFNAEPAFLERFDVLSGKLLHTTERRSDMRAAIAPVMGLTVSLNVFVVLLVGGPMAIRGELAVGDLVAFTALIAYLSAPLRSGSFLVSAFKQAQAALERVDGILYTPADRPEGVDGAPAPTRPPALSVRGLSFAWPDAPERPVLDDLSFELPAGATLGLFGPTGAGKSTLVRLLTRLTNPPPGTVFVDGVDVLALDLDDWRRRVACVPQRAFLFSEPLDENILLGAPAERLDPVLALTTLDVDVGALPQGVRTLVGEAGLMLSGGQRQRAALARGLVREPALLVLDDVLSAVDPETEGRILAGLRERAARQTTVLVANRLSALRRADLILVLEGGRVVDQGTHAELVARPGLYRETWLRQHEEAAP
jgi:ATP-binding cassette subfamily B protein